MHDRGCDEVYIIVTDLEKQEMDDLTNYFSLVCRAYCGRNKPNLLKKIRRERESPLMLLWVPLLNVYLRLKNKTSTARST